MQTKKVFWGELALIAGITIVSMGITLMIKSDFGITPVASLPFVLSKIITLLSFGTWNYLLQIVAIILLVVLTRNIKTGYYVSVFIVIGFGYMLDLFEYLSGYLPVTLPLQVVYYILGFLGIAFGVGMLIKSCMPILPFEAFVRDVSSHFDLSVKLVKTSFDLFCVIMAIILGMTFLGNIEGIGLGTLICALLTGKFVALFGQRLDSRYCFRPAIKLSGHS
ncbi:DUF6198 family protein [Syntrophomonas curvata]